MATWQLTHIRERVSWYFKPWRVLPDFLYLVLLLCAVEIQYEQRKFSGTYSLMFSCGDTRSEAAVSFSSLLEASATFGVLA